MSNDFSHLHVEFFEETTQNLRRSAEEGRPCFDSVEMVRIRAAGDKLTVFTAPANSGSSFRDPGTNERLTYAQLHHGPYDAFKRGQTFIGSGTPLSEIPFLPVAKRRELELANVHTAEALASLDGSNLQKLGMGARELRNQVAAWLTKISGNADIVKLSDENERLRLQMEQMQAQINMLASAGQKPQEAATDEYDASKSPFADWDDETLGLWIVEQGGDKPHHKCSHETLVKKADELNAALAKNKAA